MGIPRKTKEKLVTDENCWSPDIRIFLDCITSEDTSVMNAERALGHLKVISAAYRSAAIGRPEKV